MTAGVSSPNVLLAATQWVEGVLLGPLATSIAIIAIASVGLMMLTGRLNIRRGATVIVGCFILFGSASIAHGLRGAAAALTPPSPARSTFEYSSQATAPPSIIEPMTSPADPYAGAALRR